MKNKGLIFSKIIRNARESRNMNQETLAGMLGVGKTTISNYETGYSNPSMEIIYKIAAALDYTPEQMFEISNSESNKLNLPRSFQGVNDIFIPYVRPANVSVATLGNQSYMDSYVTIPSFMLSSQGNYVCVCVTDNSMAMDGISRNDYVFVKKSHNFPNSSVVLAVNLKTNGYVIRRYHRDDHIISLMPSSPGNEYYIVSYDEEFPDYKIIGYVEKVLTQIK